MRKHRITLYLLLLMIPVVLLTLVSCSITRADLFVIATSLPDIHIIPNSTYSYSFGSVNVYTTATQTFTIENTGWGILKLEKLFTTDPEKTEFILNTDQTVSLLNYGETTTFSISFKPTTLVQSVVGIVVQSNDPDESVYQFNVFGQGTGDVASPPTIKVYKGVSPITNGQSDAHDFGTVDVSSTSSVVFTVMNDSAASVDLFVSSISFKSGDITQFNRIAPSVPGSLNPGGQMEFTIDFSPEAEQIYTAGIEIISDDPVNGSFTFSVSGTGGTSSIPSEQDIHVLNDDTGSVVAMGSLGHDFTTVSVGSSSTVSFTIENNGLLDLTINDLYLDDGNNPPQFSLGSLPTFPLMLVNGVNILTFSAYYNPTENRVHNAYINITSDDPDENPFSFYLQGKGTVSDVPDMQVQVGPKKYNNGSVYYFNNDKNPIGFNGALKAVFTIKNTGKADLVVSSVLLVMGDAQDFWTDLLVPVTLQTGSTVDFNVWFQPQISPVGLEERNARIQFLNNDADENPYLIELAGFVVPN